MDIVLDTCLVIRNDLNQSRVPNFNYDSFRQILQNSQNTIFITPFSVPELFFLRGYRNSSNLVDDLKKDNISILEYDLSKLNADFSGCSYEDKYARVMIYHLTEFLKYFLCQVIFHDINDGVEKLVAIITDKWNMILNKNQPITFENCTRFMKTGAIDIIVECIQLVFRDYDIIISEKDVWELVSRTKVNTGIPFHDSDKSYVRYAKFLVNLFAKKIKSSAKTIKLSFGFNDLLIAHASDNGYVVLSSDHDLCRYLLKYGNDTNKKIINQIWNKPLSPADY